MPGSMRRVTTLLALALVLGLGRTAFA